MSKRAQIELTIEVELDEDEIWPDGAPEGWTAQHVMDEINKCSSVRNFLWEWDADCFGADVSVWVEHHVARGHLS